MKTRMIALIAWFLTLLFPFRDTLNPAIETQTPLEKGSYIQNVETIIAPFSGGIHAAQTLNVYSGSIHLRITGTGQAAGNTFSDAFYLYATPSGSISPTSPGWDLCINGQRHTNFINPTPPYNPTHIYDVVIVVPEGKIWFGVCDLDTGDNTGAYTITLREANTIDVTMSIYKSVPETERMLYGNVIGHFADAIYEMSNGSQKIGTVTIYQNGEFAENANVIWNSSVWPRAEISGYGHPGRHIYMGDEFLFADCNGSQSFYPLASLENQEEAGYSLAHEWGHYFYGLYDEYRAKCPITPLQELIISVPRPSDVPVDYSIMTSPWQILENSNRDFRWLNFSVANVTKKNGDGKTAQDRVYGVSGWETLIRSHDPLNLNPFLLGIPKRTFYPELVWVGPPLNQLPSIELPVSSEISRDKLNIIWMTSNSSDLSEDSNLGESVPFRAVLDSLGGTSINYPEPALLVASVAEKSMIALARINTSVIAPDDSTFQLSLMDDGIAPDVLANDGYYTGILPYTQDGTYTITTEFDNDLGSAIFTEIGEAHSVGPDGETWTSSEELVGEQFNQSANLNISITNMQPDDFGDIPQTAHLIGTDNTYLFGRIDRPGDQDVFRVSPSNTEKLVIRVTDLALGMVPHLKIIASNGIDIIAEYDFQSLSNTYLFAVIDARIGEDLFIEVSHQDSEAPLGIYSISIGQPYPGIESNNNVYLPLVKR